MQAPLMEQIKQTLEPLLVLLPEDIGNYWMVIFLGAALVVLLPVAWYQRRIIQVLVVGRLVGTPRFPEPHEEDLSTYPDSVAGAVGPRRLMIEGVPARVRLVV